MSDLSAPLPPVPSDLTVQINIPIHVIQERVRRAGLDSFNNYQFEDYIKSLIREKVLNSEAFKAQMLVYIQAGIDGALNQKRLANQTQALTADEVATVLRRLITDLTGIKERAEERDFDDL